jgi:hypothetical protein
MTTSLNSKSLCSSIGQTLTSQLNFRNSSLATGMQFFVSLSKRKERPKIEGKSKRESGEQNHFLSSFLREKGEGALFLAIHAETGAPDMIAIQQRSGDHYTVQ